MQALRRIVHENRATFGTFHRRDPEPAVRRVADLPDLPRDKVA
ncbi:MAG: hypothetical protein ACRDTA_10895 [Pseudonocardiaceae bacterium]